MDFDYEIDHFLINCIKILFYYKFPRNNVINYISNNCQSKIKAFLSFIRNHTTSVITNAYQVTVPLQERVSQAGSTGSIPDVSRVFSRQKKGRRHTQGLDTLTAFREGTKRFIRVNSYSCSSSSLLATF